MLRSADNLLVLKTISREESSFLRRILSQYNEYMKSNPNTTLARFWGLYKVVKGPLVRVSFIVMKNAFSSGLKIHERYDLKVSQPAIPNPYLSKYRRDRASGGIQGRRTLDYQG